MSRAFGGLGVPISCTTRCLVSHMEGRGRGRNGRTHHVGSIGSKLPYEYVSRDDPKQTIDSHSSVSVHAGDEGSS
jgi:hypothetical protein